MLLRNLLLLTAVGTLLLFFLPFVLSRWFPRGAGFVRGSLFFALIGAAFMLVEIPWIHRFILYLGHPSYATTVVLACLLLGASLGSMRSARVGLGRVRRYGLLLPVVIVLINGLLPVLFETTLGAAFVWRVVLSAVTLVPVAFVMGLFFPLGMLRFGDDNKPWFWAMNGAAGVLASVVSLALSMQFGFAAVAMGGAGMYALSWCALLGKR
jgi:hypothetical protein